jgi:hypothetical protein
MLWKVWDGNRFRKAESTGDGNCGPDAVAGDDPTTRYEADTPSSVSWPEVASGT